MKAMGTVRSWLFRASWIAAGAALGTALVIGAAGASRNVALMLAAAVGVAIHGWVVWRGVWRWDGGILGRTGTRSILASAGLGILILAAGYYLVFWRLWASDWRLNAVMVFGWLLVAVLPSRLINVQAVRSWTRRHGMGDFCARCDALLVADNRLLRSGQQAGPRGYGTRSDTYGGKKCLVCGLQA